MHVRLINENDSAAWDRMVEDHPYGCVFQTSAFRRVIAETFAHCRPIYLALVDEEGAFRAGLPLFLVKSWLTGTRLVSLPFVNYSDPLVRSAEELGALFDRAVAIYSEERASYIEIKARQSAPALAEAVQLTPKYYHRLHLLDLTRGVDSVWSKLHGSCVRKMVGRAVRRGVEVRLARSPQEVRQFHGILCENRRRLGLPPQNRPYFHHVWEYLVPCGQAEFWLAFERDSVVGGLCNFLFGPTVFLGYIAVQESFRSWGIQQNLYWTAIRSAAQSGRQAVDFGKTAPHDAGLLRYKRRWGAKELESPVFYYPCVRGVSTLDDTEKLLYRAMRGFWRHTPRPVSHLAGRLFYRHTG